MPIETEHWIAPSSSVGIVSARDAREDALRDRRRAVQVGVRKDDRELVAAEAREDVGRPQRLAHRAAQLREHDVADHVAEAVVDLLELVDVEQQQRRAGR